MLWINLFIKIRIIVLTKLLTIFQCKAVSNNNNNIENEAIGYL